MRKVELRHRCTLREGEGYQELSNGHRKYLGSLGDSLRNVERVQIVTLNSVSIARNLEHHTHPQFLRPFDRDLWLAIIGMMVLCSFFFWLTQQSKTLPHFFGSFWNFFCIFIQWGPTQPGALVGQRIITGTWSIFSIIVIST